MKQDFETYDVALSFAGEDRKYVEKVASLLRKMELRVFYDKFEKVSLWGKDLYQYLSEVYSKRAKYTVIFISKHYAEKLWPDHERKHAQAKAFSEHRESVLPARFDETEIPGLSATVFYLDLTKITPNELAKIIKEKVGPIERFEFFPQEPDRLREYFEIKDELEYQEVSAIAGKFFEDLKLMTLSERLLLTQIVRHRCYFGLPDNFHLSLEYLERLAHLSRDEIISSLSRLACLGVESKVEPTHPHHEGESTTPSGETLVVKYSPHLVDYRENGTDVVDAIFYCIYEHLCPNCAERVIEALDFSILSEAAGFPDEPSKAKPSS
jgi:hypothetical protein